MPPRRLPIAWLALLGLGACSIWDAGGEEGAPAEAFGLRPVYFPADSANVVYSDAPRAQLNNTGIVTAGDFLYVIDLGLGIHVYDNADPRSPRAVAFVHVPGIATLTASGDRLYANNFGDLVTIDISDPRAARVVDRDEGLFAQPLDFPENHIGFFECYDPARGQLVRWEEATLREPECRIDFF